MTKSQNIRLAAYAIVLVGFALRLYRLGLSSLWYDETVSLLLARSELEEITRHTAGDIHPPLYYYAFHFWGLFTGWSEFAAAFFSLFFSVVLIALVYRVAREWFDVTVALLAVSLIAASPYNVWYSQEVRMYTLGATLGLGSVYFMLRMLRANKIFSRDFFGYVVVTALGIYTLYYFIFLIIFQYLFVAVTLALSNLRSPSAPIQHLPSTVQRLSLFVTFVVSQVALALLYLPWLPIALRQATDPPVPPWRSTVSLPQMLIESVTALTFGQSVEASLLALVLVLLLGALTFIFSWRRRYLKLNPRSPFVGWSVVQSKIFLFAYTLVPLLAIFLFSLWKPLYHVRYVFTYSPAFYILLALALYVLTRPLPATFLFARRMVAGAVFAALLLGAVYSLNNFWFDPRYAKDDLRGAVQFIAENWRPNDAILVNAGYAYPALSYYYPDSLLPPMRLSGYQARHNRARAAPTVLASGSIGGSPRLGWGDPESDFYATTAEETRAALDRVFVAHPRVWELRLYDTVTDPDGVIRKYFAEHARLIDDRGFTGESNLRVQGYLTQSLTALPEDATLLKASLADRVTLLGMSNERREVRAGDYYDVTLYWQPAQTIIVNYQLSLQILNSKEEVVAQHDETPLGEALPTSRWRVGEIYREPVRVRVPEGVAPGEYHAIVKWYDLREGTVLGESITLHALQISK